MIYALVYIILVFLTLFSNSVRAEQRRYLLYLGGAVILCFQALRWRTGTDWEPYLNEFLHVDLSGDTDNFEAGYRFLNFVCKETIGTFTFFLFIECGLNLLFIILFVKKFGKINPCLGLLYFFSINIFPIRFTLASSILVYSYCYILERKFIPFLLLNILAFSIHRSSILFFPMYFICQRNYSLKAYLIVYITSICLGLAAEYTFGNVLKLASMMYGGMDATFQGKMEEYVTGEIPDAAKMTPIRYALSLINSSIFVIVFYYFKVKYFADNRMYSMLYTLYVAGISFNRIFLTVIPDLARATSFFTGGFIIMLLFIVSLVKTNVKRLALITAICAYFVFNYQGTINGFYDYLYLPYYSIFDDNFVR